MLRLKRFFSAFVIVVLAGCSGPAAEVIDLNRVLDIMAKTFENMEIGSSGQTSIDAKDTATQSKYMAEFNQQFAVNLNDAKLVSHPIETMLNEDGSVTGFHDENRNKIVDVGEKKLFTIEVDAERRRFIATDDQNGYRRDHGFSMGGLMAGMLIGNMLSRQRGAGISGARYANMRMSPNNYYSSASRKAKSSARSRSGSGSFSRGK